MQTHASHWPPFQPPIFVRPGCTALCPQLGGGGSLRSQGREKQSFFFMQSLRFWLAPRLASRAHARELCESPAAMGDGSVLHFTRAYRVSRKPPACCSRTRVRYFGKSQGGLTAAEEPRAHARRVSESHLEAKIECALHDSV
jgi:hypothetical protein